MAVPDPQLLLGIQNQKGNLKKYEQDHGRDGECLLAAVAVDCAEENRQPQQVRIRLDRVRLQEQFGWVGSRCQEACCSPRKLNCSQQADQQKKSDRRLEEGLAELHEMRCFHRGKADQGEKKLDPRKHFLHNPLPVEERTMVHDHQ